MSASSGIEARGVTKIFGGGAEAVRALDRVSVEVRENEFFTLLGPCARRSGHLVVRLGKGVRLLPFDRRFGRIGFGRHRRSRRGPPLNPALLYRGYGHHSSATPRCRAARQ